MTPEQAAAMEKAKAEFAVVQAAQEAEAARQAEEQQRYEEQQKRYEEEKRVYEEYLAAEQVRKEEEARLIEEQRLLAEQQAALAPTQISEEQANPAPEVDPSDPASLAAQQMAQAQALMAQAQALQAQATMTAASTPTPTPEAIPMPTIAPPPATNIPMPTLDAAPAHPAVTPTTPLGGYRAAGLPTGQFGRTQGMEAQEIIIPKPIWKRPVFLISFLIAFLAVGALFYVKYQERSRQQAIMDRYINFAKMGADPSIKVINGALPEDALFVLQKIKEEKGDRAWMAAVEAIHKMLPARPELTDIILESIKKEYNAYTEPKRKQLAYFVLTQKPAPDGMREKALDFYNAMPDDYKPELITVIHPLLLESDISMLIGIITDPANKSNTALTSRAELTAGRVMSRAQDKKALSQMIKQQYDNSDDAGKYIFIRLMGKTGDENGLEFLKNIVFDQNSTVIAKRNALKALGSWPNDDAIPVLLKVKDEPFGKNAETGKFVTEELYRSLIAPGRQRDMAKLQPLLDYLTAKKEQVDKLNLISNIASNAKTDKWTLDLLAKLYEDADDKVSYEAEKAMEVVKKREAPKKDDKKDSEEEGTPDTASAPVESASK